MKTVAIIGMGLIGGSLGQALRKSRRYRVLGIARKPSTLLEARRRGAIDQGSTNLKDVYQADIIVIATPVSQIVPITKQIKLSLKEGAIVTDVGSVKSPIISGISKSIHFIGAHPLAGSHKTGVQAANANLFQGATCVIVPPARGSIAPILELWRTAGAKPRIMSAAAHDRAVALISHLPHVLAHAMVHAVLGQARLIPLLAGSFRDVTRVASSDAQQWMEILNANTIEVKRAIARFEKELVVIKKKLGHAELGKYLKKSQHFRLLLFQSK